MRRGFLLPLMCFALLLAACTTEPLPASETPTRTMLPPSPTREFRLIASWTPTASPPPSATPTPRPTATPNLTLRPYLTAQPNYTPLSGQGIATPDLVNSLSWLDRFSFTAEDQPALLFELHYDPVAWQLETLLTPGGLGYQLAHRLNEGCVLSQTTGGNATDEMTVEFSELTLGSTPYYVGEATQSGELVFVTYCTSYADSPTCFIASPGKGERRCLAEIEGMLAGIRFLTNPRYTSSPAVWACRDELDTPGLCQISYTRQLEALSLPAPDQGWAVGEDGLILRKDGSSWRAESSPATTALFDIAFVDAQHGWAAGLGGLILAWQAGSWEVQMPYSAAEAEQSAIYALDFAALDDGWAVGSVSDAEGKVTPLLRHWDGQRWQAVEGLPDCQLCALSAVLALSRQEVWVSGGSGEGALLWHWDGAAWSSFAAPGASWLYALAEGEAGKLYAAGIAQAQTAQGAVVSRGTVLAWDGGQWTPLSLPPNRGGLYALALWQPGSLVVGGENTLLHAGFSWTYIATEVAGYGWITDLECDPDGRLFALTNSGFLFEFAAAP